MRVTIRMAGEAFIKRQGVVYTLPMPILRLFGSLTLVALVLFIGFILLKEPKVDGDWLPEQARTATTDSIGESITIRNVRDWTYDETGPLSTAWTDVTVDPSAITRAWFLIEPFSKLEAIGHTFLSFELEDGTVLSFSVEAKRDQGEEYSALKGQFRAYELSYQWGTERDFVTRRLIYLDHPLRLYPLELSSESAEALFRSLAEETDALAREPRFYNTLTANCTNVLATIVNHYYPGTLPYDISWNLTGYADRYLMEEELIKAEGDIASTQAAHDLTPLREDVRRIATTSPSLFSQKIRALLTQ
jgi:hypothetical protein